MAIPAATVPTPWAPRADAAKTAALDRSPAAGHLPGMAKVEIYTTPFCPYCSRAKALLAGKGVAFEEVDAPHGSAARRAAIERSGGRTTVPQVFVDGRALGGSDELAALERSGQLDTILAGEGGAS